jgi:uncharacterized protein YjbI with pentapeptide repeats
VLDKAAGCWYIVDSSVVGYDGARNLRDEELPVERKEPNRKQGEETKQSRWGFRGMTVREWLELLIVPVVLALITVVFTWQQNVRQQDLETKRTNQAQKIENKRAEAERELAVQRAQDEALQSYLNQMSSLLLEKDLRTSKEDNEVRTLARARTLTVLSRLEPSRKTALMQFLVEADLVQRVDGRDPIISLHGANLSGANLSGADLSGANLLNTDLSGATLIGADLRGANLRYADLRGANLLNTDLSGADLSEANLSGADLRYAFLSGATLSLADLRDADLSGAFLRDAFLRDADLSEANLSKAVLSDADLVGADLRKANLSDADLSEANLISAYLTDADLTDADLTDADLTVTNEQLEQQVSTLEGATMPNGQKYEDWLKSKEG